MTAERWQQQLAETIGTVLGAGLATQFERAWQEAEDRPGLRVVLLGPTSAGKTTLIRRLLSEEGAEIPDWLAITADVTTSAVREAPGGLLAFVDTPGTASGMEGHAEQAWQALSDADAVMVVLPTTFELADYKELLQEVYSGRWFNAEHPLPLPGGAFVPVISRMDDIDGGYEPGTDAFTRICRRKAENLRERLDAPQEMAVHTVYAALYGAHRGENPAEEDRATDGIDGLLGHLLGLADRVGELRAAAGTRYWCLAGARTLTELAATHEQTSVLLHDAEGLRGRTSSLLDELRALDGAARIELSQKIRELCAGQAEVLAGGNKNAVSKTLEESFPPLWKRWEDEFGQRLANLADEIGLHLTQAQALADKAVSLRDGHPAATGGLGGLGRLVLENAAKAAIGMISVSQVPRSSARIVHETIRSQSIGDLSNVVTWDRTDWTVLSDPARRELIPAVVGSLMRTFVGIIGDIARERDARKRLEKSESALRDHADQLVQFALAPGGPDKPGWAPNVEKFRAALTHRLPAEEDISAFKNTLAQLDAAADRLRELLRARPGPDPGTPGRP